MLKKGTTDAKHGKCGSCGSEMEKESGHMVCTGCGVVDTTKQLDLADDPLQSMVPNDVLFGSQSARNTSVRNALSAQYKTSSSFTPSRLLGIKVAETLAINYSFNTEMKDYLMSCYKKALIHKNFFKCSLKNKEILAAVCAYITLMKNDHSIAIQYICSSVDCNGYDFKQMYTLFVNSFPDCKPEAKPIEELVASVLRDFGVNSEEFNELERRVIDIISIEKACWLVDGRSPLHVITAATYLGWKSLKPVQRANFKFTQFCKLFKIRQMVTTVDRIKEQTEIFIKLAKHIPIVKRQSTRVHRNNVALFVDDIIQYSNSLIFDLRRDVYRKLNEEQNSSQTTKEINYNEENDEKWMNSFKRKVFYEKSGHKKTDELEIKADEDLDEENEENEGYEKSDKSDDISDSEINCYLRSDLEIKYIKKMYKRAKHLNANK